MRREIQREVNTKLQFYETTERGRETKKEIETYEGEEHMNKERKKIFIFPVEISYFIEIRGMIHVNQYLDSNMQL